MVFSLILAVVGAVMLFLAIRNRRKARESTLWPVTEGRILSSGVRRTLDTSSDSSSYNYIPELVYEYAVEGRPYQGARIHYGSNQHSTEMGAWNAISEFPAGAVVPVHYDPARPNNAVLKVTAPGMSVLAIVGAVMILGAIVLPLVIRSR